MHILKKHFAFITIVVLMVPILIFGCRNSVSINEENTIDDVLLHIKAQLPEYKLIKPSMVRTSESPIPSITKDFMDGIDTGYEVIHSFDLNDDGYDDYLTTVYKTYELQNNEKYDSVFEAKSITIFGGENLISTTRKMYFRQTVFNDTLNIKINENYKFTNPGYFLRSYPFNDTVYIEHRGVGVYSPYGIGITEWISIDSIKTTYLYAY